MDAIATGSKRLDAGTHRSRTPAETLARIRPLMARFGITRVANVTGLDRVGIPVALAIRPNARAIAAAARRTRWLAFGAGDYTRDMAMDWTRDEVECDHARAEIALASRAEGLTAPIDTVD